MKILLIPLVSVVVCLTSLSAQETIWKTSFGKGEAVGYWGGEVLEVVKEGEGAFLRVVLPGRDALEGVRVGLGEVEGGRLLEVKGRMRGKGTVGLMIQAANGWTRLPQMTLDGEWREVRIPKALKAGANHPVLYVVSLPKEVPQPGAIFELSDFEATLAPPETLPEREVPPRRVGARELAARPEVLQSEGEVTVLTARTPLISNEIPFPQTQRPVNVYLHYRAASPEDRLQLCTRFGGVKQAVREIRPEGEGWQWLVLPEVTAHEVGEQVTVELWPAKVGAESGEEPAALEALVFSSEAALDEATLDQLN